MTHNFILRNLAVGNLQAVGNTTFKYVFSIVGPGSLTCMVDLRDIHRPTTSVGEVYHKIFIVNDGNYEEFRELLKEENFQWVHECIHKGNTLINCGAGLSRSAAFCTSYLSWCGFDPLDAKSFVEKRRPGACISPVFMDAIKSVFPDPSPSAFEEEVAVKMIPSMKIDN